MDYGTLIREAWSATWRYRSLWVLGLFAGGAAGGIGGGGGGGGGGRSSVEWREPARGFVPPDGFPWPDSRVDMTADQITSWAASNIGLILAAAGVVLAVSFGLLVIGLIAQGGMAEATVDIARGETTSLGRAWRAGLQLFWRFAGLWLTLAVAAIAVAVVVGAAVAFFTALAGLGASAQAGNAPWIMVAAAAVLLGIPAAVLTIAAAVALSIVVAYAQRAIYAEDAGPLEALREGWGVFRGHIGESLIVWVINLALGIAAGIAGGIVLLPLLAVLGGIGVALWASAGLSALTIAYAALGGLLVIAAGALVAAVANTFFWNYWTRAYLRLTAHQSPHSLDGSGIAATSTTG